MRAEERRCGRILQSGPLRYFILNFQRLWWYPLIHSRSPRPTVHSITVCMRWTRMFAKTAVQQNSFIYIIAQLEAICLGIIWETKIKQRFHKDLSIHILYLLQNVSLILILSIIQQKNILASRCQPTVSSVQSSQMDLSGKSHHPGSCINPKIFFFSYTMSIICIINNKQYPRTVAYIGICVLSLLPLGAPISSHSSKACTLG